MTTNIKTFRFHELKYKYVVGDRVVLSGGSFSVPALFLLSPSSHSLPLLPPLIPHLPLSSPLPPTLPKKRNNIKIYFKMKKKIFCLQKNNWMDWKKCSLDLEILSHQVHWT